MELALRRLDLRFDLGDPERRDYPLVTILVDGEDVLADAPGGPYIGFDPADILGHNSALLPTDPPRRVAVYRCCCGEPGCGVVAPLISEAGGVISWSDFRDYTGVFARPDDDASTTTETRADGRGFGLSEICFESEQYRTEVLRACADRSWETERRKTARILHDHLRSGSAVLERRGYRLDWAALCADDPTAYRVSLWKANRQVVIEVRANSGSSEEQAADMAHRLLRTDPDDWQVVFRGGTVTGR